MAITGFDRTPILEIGQDAYFLLALQNFCQEILTDLINKSLVDLSNNNKKANELQVEMNDLFFLMSELVLILDKRIENFAREAYHEEIAESKERRENEFRIEEKRLSDLNLVYEQYQATLAQSILLKEFETRHPKLRDELLNIKANLVNQLEKENRNIVILQNNLSRLDQNIHANVQNIVQNASYNYVVSDLRIGNNIFKFDAAELDRAVQEEYGRDLNRGEWHPDNDLIKMEKVFTNLGMKKLVSRSLDKMEYEVQNMIQWAKVEARGYVNRMRTHMDYSTLLQLFHERQDTQVKLDNAVSTAQNLEKSISKIDNALVRLEETVTDNQNPNGKLSIEQATKILSEIDEVKNEVSEAEDNSIGLDENIVDNLDQTRISAFEGDDDFDMDSEDDDYTPPPAPAPADNSPSDGLPPPYNPDDLGPPPGEPPNERDPG
jgi:hypothetical protein